MYNFLSYLIYLTVVNNRYLIHGNQKLEFEKCYSSCNHYLKQIKTLGSCLSCYNQIIPLHIKTTSAIYTFVF